MNQNNYKQKLFLKISIVVFLISSSFLTYLLLTLPPKVKENKVETHITHEHEHGESCNHEVEPKEPKEPKDEKTSTMDTIYKDLKNVQKVYSLEPEHGHGESCNH